MLVIILSIILIIVLISLVIFFGIKSSKKCETSENFNNSKIEKFKAYLKEKLTLALKLNLAETNVAWTNANQFGIGIYVKNTPENQGPVKVWSTFCGFKNNLCPNVTEEPKFYFGSGTKPITCALVASQLYKLWRKNNPNSNPEEFLEWYGGPKGSRGAPPAVTYKDLFNLTNGFKYSNFNLNVRCAPFLKFGIL